MPRLLRTCSSLPFRSTRPDSRSRFDSDDEQKTKQQRTRRFHARRLRICIWPQMTNTAFETSSRTTTTGLIAQKKMPKLWSCLASKTDDEKRDSRNNKKINAKLKKDKKIYKATYRLLLLGEPFSPHCRSCLSFSFRRRRVRQVNRCQTDENPTQSIHNAVRRHALLTRPIRTRFRLPRERADRVPDIKRNIRDALTVSSL